MKEQKGAAADAAHAKDKPRVSFVLPTRDDAPGFEQVIVRMPPAGKAALRRLAKEAGMSLSAFCRAVLLSVVEQAGAQAADGKPAQD